MFYLIIFGCLPSGIYIAHMEVKSSHKIQQGAKMEPEKFKQLEAKLKSLFEEAEKEDAAPKMSMPAISSQRVVIRRRNGVSMKLVS